MRIAAGIMMIIVSLTSATAASSLVEVFGFGIINITVPLSLLSMGLIWGGAICAFRKKAYNFALVGALCSIISALAYSIISVLTGPFPYPEYPILPGTIIFFGIFVTMGILALVFLIKREGEFKTEKTDRFE